MKKTRLAALLLTLALALSLAVPAAAYNSGSLVPQKRTYSAPFSDTRGAWCESYVKTVYEAGLMDGKSAAQFDPSGSLTHAQTVVIAARLHELLHGGDGVLPAPTGTQPWYQPAVAYLTQNISEDTEAGSYLLYDLYAMSYYADLPCDRYDFVWYLAAVLPESALAPINAVTVLPDTSDADVLRFYNAGILTGSDKYGSFHGSDLLNRGQAAAMLARIVDPAQREKFTPEVLVASQALLGLAPDAPMLTVDGYTVTAEMYAFALSSNISAMEVENYFSYYETYPEYYEAYWADDDFEGGFADYLLEKYNIDVDAPIDWNTPDKGGMTPAQKVREDTLAEVKQMAALINHQSGYALTTQQEIEAAEYVKFAGSLAYGYSADFVRQLCRLPYLFENLSSKYAMSASEINRYLAESGYIYGQYATMYYSEESGWQYTSEAEARETAETVRSQMASHRNEPDYIGYLIWKYSDSYSSEPGLISISGYSSATQTALKDLGVNQVSGVLKEDGAFVVVLKLDPSQDAYVSASAAAIPAQAQLLKWTEAAAVTTTAAYDAVDVAAAAAAADGLIG